MQSYVKYTDIVEHLDIRRGDILLIGSDITRLVIASLKNGERIDVNTFLNSFLEKIGEEGTLLLPTFNWGYCSGETFDYRQTVSLTGALTNAALQREDFIRTKHPIYSFAVWGKYSEYLSTLDNESSFGPDSPFAFLHHEKAKMLIVGLDFQHSFTFVHYVEEANQVHYRFKKYFTSIYIDKDGVSSERTYSMNVRDWDRGVTTFINPMGQLLEEQRVAIHTNMNNNDFYLIDLDGAYKVIQKDIRENDARNLYIIK
jgi:aminoglycoside 3-N-acetyltransferase